ncbi:hypothetical protein QKA_1959 [Clostridioides difficile DA00165]|nr:hypothetical protein QKA_1959 [Clostridioides difficile DA00165]
MTNSFSYKTLSVLTSKKSLLTFFESTFFSSIFNITTYSLITASKSLPYGFNFSYSRDI